MAHSTDSSRPFAVANPHEPTTEHAPLRAKRLTGAAYSGGAYRRAKAVVAHAVRLAITEHASQRDIARAAGVTQRLVQQWIDADGSNGLRLDLALAIAEDGGPSCRNVIVQVLREVLAVAESGLGDVTKK
jgi:hypothetical protein